jgi:AraC-like DNA-binding protein
VNRSDETGRLQPKLAQIAGNFRERLPASALRRHVDRVWTSEFHGATALDIVPDGCIDIVWSGSSLRIAGPNTHVAAVTVEGGASLAGVRFQPGVAARWLGVSAMELVNTQPLLEDFWGRRATAQLSDKLAAAKNTPAAGRILEDTLIGRLHRVAPADPIIGATVAAAAKGTARDGIVRGLIDEFGWSERTLRRRCLDAFGYGPKTLARILRFQRFLRLLSSAPATLSVLAVEAGYADQAHLAREVRRLSGQSPSALMSELQS